MINKTLYNIAPNNISPNPHNPRLIFDEEGMSDLKQSIEKVGILVPLTVYPNRKEYLKTEYILLDGERRWRVAKELGLETIPANVIEEPKDITQNILYMFNIHHYRKEWALFPTALKLEVLIKALDTENEAQLARFTGIDRSMIRRCKILLWYPTKYRDLLMLKRKISTDFFIELYPIAYRLSNESEYEYPNGVEFFVDKMISKFEGGEIITDVKEFRDIRRSMGYFDDAGRFDEFKAKMGAFLSDSTKSLDVFVSPEVETSLARKNILKYTSYLITNLKDIDVNSISDLETYEALDNLSDLLEMILIKLE